MWDYINVKQLQPHWINTNIFEPTIWYVKYYIILYILDCNLYMYNSLGPLNIQYIQNLNNFLHIIVLKTTVLKVINNLK